MYLSTRMEAVQRPIIPVVGELIRQHPGTISLGQGVVHWGPPRQAIESIGGMLADGQNHKYKPVDGIAELIAAHRAQAADRKRHHGWRREPRRGDSRRQHGVFQRAVGDRRSRGRDHPACAVLLQPRDGGGDAQLPRRCSADRRELPGRSGGHRTSNHEPHAPIVTISPNNPTARFIRKRCSWRSTSCAADAGFITSATRRMNTSYTTARGTFRRARLRAPLGTRFRSTRCRRPMASRVRALGTW